MTRGPLLRKSDRSQEKKSTRKGGKIIYFGSGSEASRRTEGRPCFSVIIISILLVLILAAGGCSKKKKAPSPEIPPTAKPGETQWTYGSNAVVLRIKADTMLNSYEDRSHTLSLCVYQFKSPNTFKDLSKNKKGVLKLLSCKKFSDSVAGVQRIIVYPGELRNVFIDRAEGAQWVGLAAGYYDLDPAGATRLIQIPVEVIKKGLIFKKKYFVPNKLISRIFFGPSEISHYEEGSVADEDDEIEEVKSKKVSETEDADKSGKDGKKASKESDDGDEKASKESDDGDEKASKEQGEGGEEASKKTDGEDKKDASVSDDDGKEAAKKSEDSSKESADKDKGQSKDVCDPCAVSEDGKDAEKAPSVGDDDSSDPKKKKKKPQADDDSGDSEPDNKEKNSGGENEQAAADEDIVSKEDE